MVHRRIAITKEEYLENVKKEKKEISEFIMEKLPVEILCGYGYYGGFLKEENGEFFIEAITGSSCD